MFRVKRINNMNLKYLFPSMVISLFICNFMIKPFENNPIKEVNGMVGQMVLNDISINSMISKWQLTIFFIIPLLTIFLNYMLSNINKKYDVIKDYTNINLFSFVCFFISIKSFIFLDYKNYLEFFCIYILINTMLIQVCFKKIGFIILEEEIPFLQLTSIVLYGITKLFLFSIVQKDSIVFLIFIFIDLIKVILFVFLKKYISFKEIIKICYPFSFFMILVSVSLEIFALLAEKHIVFNNYKLIIFFVIMGLVVFSLLLYFTKIEIEFENYFYPILSGFVLLSTQSPAFISTGVELMEKANHNIGVYQFLNFGKIPILETFDAHMLSNQLSSYIYYFLSNNIKDAPFFEAYHSIIIGLCINLGIFTLIKKYFDSYLSLIVLILTNFVPILALNHFITIIGFLVIYNFYQNRNTGSLLLLLTYNLIGCFYTLDSGTTNLVSTFFILILLEFKNKIFTKKMVFIIISFLGVNVIIAFAIASIRNINLIERVKEFISICLSNDLFAYSSFGDKMSYDTQLYYYIVPMIVSGIFIYELFGFINNKEITMDNILLNFLCIDYIYFFQRTIVRHNLFEGVKNHVLTYTVILIFLFVYFRILRRIIQYNNIVIFVIISYLVGMFFGFSPIQYNTVLENINTKITEYNSKQYIDISNNNGRIIYEKELMQYVSSFKQFCDIYMDGDETYFDFNNTNLLYTLVEKENPVYVNQSPLLFSNFESQNNAIKQIKSHKVPFVLMKVKNSNNTLTHHLGYALDDIANEYHYINVCRYITRNYIPFAEVGDIEVWCLKEKYDEKMKILSQNLDIKFLYGKPDLSYYNTYLMKYPSIQARLQYNNVEEFQEYTNEMDINITNKNILLLKIHSDIDSQSTLTLYFDDKEINYKFDIIQGENIYAFYLDANLYFNLSSKLKFSVDNINEVKYAIVKDKNEIKK